jgi:hypothetical protein
MAAERQRGDLAWLWSDSGFVLQPVRETYTVAKSDGASFEPP